MRIDLVTPAGIRAVLPRDGAGHFIAQGDSNDHPSRNLAGDLLAQVLGLSDDGLAATMATVAPSTARVAETDRHARNLGYSDAHRARIKGTRQGRGVFGADAANAAGRPLSLKLMSSDDHAAVVLTTPRAPAAAAIVSEIAAYHAAGGDIPVVVVAAEALHGPKQPKHYRLDASRLAWQIIYPYREVRDLATLLASKRGRGRPKAGEVLPNVWATPKPNTTCIGGSIQILGRARSLSENGWTRGTLADLIAAVEAL